MFWVVTGQSYPRAAAQALQHSSQPTGLLILQLVNVSAVVYVRSFSLLFQWASITLTLINNNHHHHHFTAIKTIVATVDKLLQAQQEADADEEEVTGKIRETATPKHTTKTQTTGTSTTTTSSVTSTLVMA
jgi:hypothetical protein